MAVTGEHLPASLLGETKILTHTMTQGDSQLSRKQKSFIFLWVAQRHRESCPGGDPPLFIYSGGSGDAQRAGSGK